MAVWVEVPLEIKRRFAQNPDRFDRGGLHAIEHVLMSIAPLEVMCDPADLSCQHTRRHTDINRFVSRDRGSMPSRQSREMVALGPHS
jgi:ATP-dependent helicase YprA (DUF1998 family)